MIAGGLRDVWQEPWLYEHPLVRPAGSEETRSHDPGKGPGSDALVESWLPRPVLSPGIRDKCLLTFGSSL